VSLVTNKKKIRLEEIVLRTLQNGRMPSLLEMKRWIRSNETKNSSLSPADFSNFYVNGNSLTVDNINKFIEEYKIDLKAIHQTIEDGWNELDIILNNVIAISTIYDSSIALTRAAKSSLSTIDLADTFYNLKSIGSSIAADSWDLSISENVLLDMYSGSISLSKNSIQSIEKNKLNIVSSSIYPESNTVIIESGDTFGTYQNVFDSSVVNRYVKVVYSKENDARIINELVVSISEIETINEAVIYTTSKSELFCEIYTTYDGSNWTKFGETFGNGKIIIYGEPTEAILIKIKLTKTRSDNMIDGKEAYIFDINEIDFARSSYSEIGYVISDSIENISEVVSASIEYIGENTENIQFYLANDVDGAIGKDDFQWKSINEDMSWLAKPVETSNIIEIDRATKYFYGPGSLYDIYQIGTTEDVITYAEEGYNQFEVRYKSITYGTVETVSRLDFDTRLPHQSIVGVGDISLTKDSKDTSAAVPNYFHITTKIYSDFNTSTEFMIDNTISKFKIYINGQDLTEFIRNGSVSIPLSIGENILEIVLLINVNSTTENNYISITPKSSAHIAINKLEISTKETMASTTPRICIHDKNIIVNKYSEGKTYRLFVSKIDTDIVRNLRVMARLVRTAYGASPSIRQIILRTGV
jgi:hypothetical protein